MASSGRRPRPQLTCVFVLLAAWFHLPMHITAAAAAIGNQQPTECVVNIEGAARGGIRSASMECSGAPVSVSVNRNLLGPFTSSFQGVDLLTGKHPGCLLTLVGDSKATFVNSRLRGIRAELVPGLDSMLCVAGSSSLVVLNSSVSNNNGTGVAAFERAHVTLNASTISNNTVVGIAGGLYVAGRAVAVVAGGSSIEGNLARSRSVDGKIVDGVGGGVLVAEDATLEVTGSSSIAGNRADRIGGGISGSDNAAITVTGNSSIANNRAGNASGVAVADAARLLIIGGSQIVGNAVNVVQFGLHDTAEASAAFQDAPVTAFPNGRVSITGGVVFKGNGVEGQGLNQSMLQMGEQLGFAQFFSRKDVSVYPGATLEMDESVSGDKGPLNVCSGSVARMFMPALSTCPAGSFPDSALFCKCCPESRYSFSTDITVADCRVCPQHATCPGANRVLPDAGHWHSSPQSVQIHACPGGMNACGKDGKCEPGYAGNLCGSCAPNHGSTLPFWCVRCMSPGRQIGLHFLLGFATFLFILLTVLSTYRDNMQGATHVRPSDVIKVLVHFLQFLVILGSISAPWPAMLHSLFAASTLVYGAGTGQALSPNCWLSLLKLAYPPLAVQRALLNFITPVVLFCCVAATVAALCAVLRWLAGCRKARGQSRAHQFRSLPFLRQLPIVAIVVVFYAFPTVVKTALSFFACLPIDDSSQQPYPELAVRNHTAGYSLMDINAECYVGWHSAWAFGLGLPAVVVLCAGVPVWLLVFLVRAGRTGKAANASFQEKFGFLYRNYRDKCVAWEAVWAVQTVLLTTVAVLQYSISVYYCIILLSVIFLASAVLEAVMQPYADRRLHHLSLASSACLFLTAQCTLVLFTASRYALESLPASVPVVIGVLLVVMNAGFVLVCLGLIVACVVQPRRKQLAQLVAKVTPCLKA